MMMIVLDVQKN